MTDSTYIAKSSIHGKGLFAKFLIEKNSIIGWLQGVPSDTDGPHVLWIDADNGFEVECHLRYINHSDEPNACYYDDLSVMAIRDIEAGEEITHNYNSGEW